MYLWLLERTDRVGWDEFASFVVAAEDEEKARAYFRGGSWEVDQGYIRCVRIGTLDPAFAHEVEEGYGVILADFNAG
jgi:hypothetical protein